MTNQTINKSRDSFIIYRSFIEAINSLQDVDRLQIFDAIFAYALDEKETNLSGISHAIFTLIKPQLEANNKRFKNGCKDKKKSKTEAKQKQNRSKVKANDNVNDNVNDNENLKSESKFELPNFIDCGIWNSFVEHRKSKKCKLTERAAKLILKDLQLFENKSPGAANIALENSIKNGWQGVFEPKTLQQSKSNSTADVLRNWASKE